MGDEIKVQDKRTEIRDLVFSETKIADFLNWMAFQVSDETAHSQLAKANALSEICFSPPSTIRGWLNGDHAPNARDVLAIYATVLDLKFRSDQVALLSAFLSFSSPETKRKVFKR